MRSEKLKMKEEVKDNLYSPSKRHPESNDPNMIFHDFKDFPDKKWEPYLD